MVFPLYGDEANAVQTKAIRSRDPIPWLAGNVPVVKYMYDRLAPSDNNLFVRNLSNKGVPNQVSPHVSLRSIKAQKKY